MPGMFERGGVSSKRPTASHNQLRPIAFRGEESLKEVVAKPALELCSVSGYCCAQIGKAFSGRQKIFESDLAKSADFVKRSEPRSSSSAMELFGMKKQLIWLRKAFPNSLFVAIGLLLYHFVYVAPAAQKCDCPCADKKLASAAQSSSGQLTLVWPRDDTFLGRAFHAKAEVQIDAAPVGAVDFDAPLTVSVANGPHRLAIKQKNGYLDALSKTYETQIEVSAQKPLYFQIVEKGTSIYTSELNGSTALALLNTGPKIPSGPGTIYLYWPKTGPDLGFFDKMSTDLPAFLDGKRIGIFTTGDYVMVKAPAGDHELSLDMTMLSSPLIRKKFTLEGGSTHYFHVEKRLDYHIIEDAPDESAEFAKKGLRQREASAQ
jgi:hypothetical protein